MPDLLPHVGLPVIHHPGARILAQIGIFGVLVATVTISILHVVAPSDHLDPLSRTISEYALLPDGWAFNAGVLILAAASALILLALIHTRLLPKKSLGTVMTAVWCIGLVGLVIFPKQILGPDSSLAGRVHWTWTLVAFFSLPIGLIDLWRRHRGNGRALTWWTMALASVSGAWFVILALQTLLSALNEPGAWNYVGLIERGLSATEMAAVVVLGAWAIKPVLAQHHLPPAPEGLTAAERAGTAGSP